MRLWLSSLPISAAAAYLLSQTVTRDPELFRSLGLDCPRVQLTPCLREFVLAGRMFSMPKASPWSSAAT